MTYFHNERMLWKFVNNQIKGISKEDLDSLFSETSFLMDFKRSSEELYINGNSIDSILGKKPNEIETSLSEAANVVFNRLFAQQSKEATELELATESSDTKKSDEMRKTEQEACFKNFLRLFLHQGFIFPNINILSTLNQRYLFLTPEKKRIDLTYTDDSLFIQVSFATQKIHDLNSKEVLEVTHEDFFVKGEAKYRVNIRPYNITGWIAQFDLIHSTLECKDEWKDSLDTRNILEKFQEFLTFILDKLKNYLNLENSVSNQTKFKPFFFLSNDGSSVSESILDNEIEQPSKILEIALRGMSR
jgi:hypothetical protein